jgi:hypothetical protein
VDDILIIYDQTRADEDTIYSMINSIDEHLEFKISREENETISYLDLSMNRNTNNVALDIYRKPTYMDITIHFSYNQPHDHKIAAFKYYINRMITMPITEQAVKQEWNKIIIMARNNGFPKHIIHKLRSKLITKGTGHHKSNQCNNTVRDGSPSHIMALQYEKLPIHSNALTCRQPSILPI